MFQEIRQHLDPDQQGGSHVDSARALGIHPSALRVYTHRLRKRLVLRVRTKYAPRNEAA